MTTKQSDFADLNALAMEACDLWQEHLSTFARDPSARAELTRFLEPQRRMFADWASMMRQGVPGGTTDQGGKHEAHRAKPEPAKPAAKESETHAASTATAAPASSGGAAHGDDALRVAQLALRVAELEKRLAQLEGQPADSGAKSDVAAARRTQRTAS